MMTYGLNLFGGTGGHTYLNIGTELAVDTQGQDLTLEMLEETLAVAISTQDVIIDMEVTDIIFTRNDNGLIVGVCQ